MKRFAYPNTQEGLGTAMRHVGRRVVLRLRATIAQREKWLPPQAAVAMAGAADRQELVRSPAGLEAGLGVLSGPGFIVVRLRCGVWRDRRHR